MVSRSSVDTTVVNLEKINHQLGKGTKDKTLEADLLTLATIHRDNLKSYLDELFDTQRKYEGLFR